MEGVLIRTFEGDPRISDAQVKAMSKIATADHTARVMGLDARMRPVINACLGVPRQERTFSIMRNGDPATVEYEGSGSHKTLHEKWTGRPLGHGRG